jgi:hypothetical protein
VKVFSHRRVEVATGCTQSAAHFLLWSTGMTSIPRDSDIIGAAALLAIVLVSGLYRAFGL